MTSPYPFTSHNIQLPDGVQTFPQAGAVVDDYPICRAALRTLGNLYPPETRSGITIVDLGCLKGGYTLAFAKAGYNSLGIDAREINIRNCEYAADKFRLPNLRFVRDDVRNIERYGEFDAIFCCGLLYHVDEPLELLTKLSRCARGVLILQTHYSLEYLPGDPGLAAALSDLTIHEGLMGRWYSEGFSESTSNEEVEHAVWSAYGNTKSFWIEKRHLLQCLRDVDFSIVYEQFDYLTDISKGEISPGDKYLDNQHRSMFIAIKQPAL